MPDPDQTMHKQLNPFDAGPQVALAVQAADVVSLPDIIGEIFSMKKRAI